MTLHTGQQILTTHMLPYDSRSKGNQKMKFSRLINYSVRNIFLEKPYRKLGRKISSRPLFFLKKKSLYIR